MKKYECFLSVIETGSFSETAKKMNYTQPAVSHMIRSLENELQTRLFLRSRHGLQLTYEGSMLVPYIEGLLKAKNALIQKSMEIRNKNAGVLKIATFETFFNGLMPDILTSFRKEFPDVVFEFFQGYYREIDNWVNKDMVNFGITCLDDSKGEFQKKLLFKEPYYVALPKLHPLAKHSVLTAEEIKDEIIITLDEGDAKNIFNVMNKKGGYEISPKYQFCNYDGISASIEKGLGISLLPELACRKESSSKIIFIPFSPVHYRSIGIIYKNKEKLTAISNRFLEHVISHIEANE